MSQAGLLDPESNNPQIPTSFVTDSGIAIPLLNTLNILGINGATTSGSGNTVTIDVSGAIGIITINGDSGSITGNPVTFTGDATGLTFSGAGSTMTLGGILALSNGGTSANLTASNGGIFYSNATTGAILPGTPVPRRMLQSGIASAPAWSTSTWPATTTINQILYSSANNVVAQITAANNGTLISSATGVPSWLANGTTGQVLTATTGSPPSWGASSFSAMPWTNITGATQALVVNNGYFANNAGAVTFTLPASATIGNIIRIADMQGGWIIAQNANQQILYGNQNTTVGVLGQVASGFAGDCVELVATNTSASTVWRIISGAPNITLT